MQWSKCPFLCHLMKRGFTGVTHLDVRLHVNPSVVLGDTCTTYTYTLTDLSIDQEVEECSVVNTEIYGMQQFVLISGIIRLYIAAGHWGFHLRNRVRTRQFLHEIT